MTEPDEFDQFYRDVRARVLLVTYCLTGDLPSSRAAVREAFVVAWHHWRKVSRVEDPEAWVRERACRRARRRHTAKLWHREKGLDPEAKATLDALGKLSFTERRVLLVAELTSVSLNELAREVGLPRTDAERALQTATAQFALHREVPTTSVRIVLEAIGDHIESSRLPRATIVRRAGATRRRTHTVIGVAATVATLVVTGTLLTDADGVRPTLADERVERSHTPAPDPIELTEEDMVDVQDVAASLPAAGWRVTATDDNTTGSGLVAVCQEGRYAGRPIAAQVRTLDANGATDPQVVQLTEAARTEKAATRAYDTAAGWFAGCGSKRAQLMATYAAPSIGDDAVIVVLHTWAEPDQNVIAAVARTGRYTTSVVSSVNGSGRPRAPAVGTLLGAAVDRLCELPGGGSCAGVSTVEATAPMPVAAAPGMLAEVDLPPVGDVTQPWVGTAPRRASDNPAATTCDATDFSGPAMRKNLTRTFLIPDADLADQFGLTETVGTLPVPKAKAFVAGVRTKLSRCADKQVGTDVTQLVTSSKGARELTVWRVSTEISQDETVVYLMGIVRNGTAVAQVGFVPDGKVTLTVDAFEGLAQRALDRLAAMTG